MTKRVIFQFECDEEEHLHFVLSKLREKIEELDKHSEILIQEYDGID